MNKEALRALITEIIKDIDSKVSIEELMNKIEEYMSGNSEELDLRERIMEIIQENSAEVDASVIENAVINYLNENPIMTNDDITEIVENTFGNRKFNNFVNAQIDTYLENEGILENLESTISDTNEVKITMTEDMWVQGVPNWTSGTIEESSIWITKKDFIDKSVEKVQVNNEDYVLSVYLYDFNGRYVKNVVNGGIDCILNHDEGQYIVALRLDSKQNLDTSHYIYCDLQSSLKTFIKEETVNSVSNPFESAYWRDSTDGKLYLVKMVNGALDISEQS